MATQALPEGVAHRHVRFATAVHGGATSVPAPEVRTPDGAAVVALVIAERAAAAPADARITATCDGGLRAGHGYELEFLCRSTSTGSLRISDSQGMAPSRQEVTLHAAWQQITLAFIAEAGRGIPELVAHGSAAATVFLGPAVLREQLPIAPLASQWSAFVDVVPPAAYGDIPAELPGRQGLVAARTVTLEADSLDLTRLSAVATEKSVAVLYNQFTCSAAGEMRIGVSADWWLELHLNGELIHSTLATGNRSSAFTPRDHLITFQVKAGRNLLAAKVLSGSRGWRFVCGAPTGISAAPFTQDSVLLPFVANRQQIGGVTLIASRERILGIDACGFANLRSGAPMRPDTMFWIASQTKSMTATALMMLVDEGKVRLDDPLELHLPEFAGQMMIAEQDADHVVLRRPQRPPSIRDVLSHTSGLLFSTTVEEKLDVLPLSIAIKSYSASPLQFEPGSRYLYSNAGINTAGRIIEVVSGMPYERFMQERLFTPLGMSDTTFWPSAEQVARLATSYRALPDGSLEEMQFTQLTYPFTDPTRRPMPAGGLFATVGDVARYGQFTLNGGTNAAGRRLLSAASSAEMLRRQTRETIAEAHGLCWSIGSKIINGGAAGTRMELDPQTGAVAVYMIQQIGGTSGCHDFMAWADRHFARLVRG